MSGTIRKEVTDGICTLTLENQGKRNAVSYPMMFELIEEFEALSGDGADDVVVLTGAGTEAFSAGFDLTQERGDHEGDENPWPRMADAIAEYEYPTIAMINGATYGGAMEIVAACDLRLATRGARFGITPAKLGIVYSGRAIHRVMKAVGPAKTKELLFTGEPITAENAYDAGLLNYVLDSDDELADRTYEMAETIASNAPLSITYMKRILNALEAKGELTDAERDWAGRLRASAFESDDYAEGVEAFSENREPEFEGR